MMNELIQKFAEQADLFADSKLQMKGEYHPDWHDVRDEKFAELIVRECTKVLTQHGAYFSGEGEPYHYAASLIEEHFGVE